MSLVSLCSYKISQEISRDIEAPYGRRLVQTPDDYDYDYVLNNYIFSNVSAT